MGLGKQASLERLEGQGANPGGKEAGVIYAFILGLIEFRSDLTTSTDYIEAYDWGREIAHRLTLRYWD